MYCGVTFLVDTFQNNRDKQKQNLRKTGNFSTYSSFLIFKKVNTKIYRFILQVLYIRL